VSAPIPLAARWGSWPVPSLGLLGVALAALAIGAAAGSLELRTRRGAQRSSGVLAEMSLFVSLVGIAAVTLRPTDGDHEIHLVPLQDILGAVALHPRPAALAGLVGNLLLFSPLGAAACVRGDSLRRAGVVALGTSLAVEMTQLWIPGRTTSTDDIVLNVLGALLGFVAFEVSARWVRDRRG
jgi:glycopeptide antibiotics resistance protein